MCGVFATAEERVPVVGTRRQIIEVFWKQAFEYGIRGVSVRSLMAEVGMNRSTFYDNFNSIDDLVRISEDQIIGDLLDEVSRVGPDLTAGDVFGNISKLLPRYGRRIAVLLSSGGDPQFFERMRGAMAPALFTVLGIDEEPEVMDLISLLISSALTGVLSECFAKGYDDQTMVREFFKMDKLLFHGLAQFTDRDPFAGDSGGDRGGP